MEAVRSRLCDLETATGMIGSNCQTPLRNFESILATESLLKEMSLLRLQLLLWLQLLEKRVVELGWLIWG